jgi:CBS domain-containing protein
MAQRRGRRQRLQRWRERSRAWEVRARYGQGLRRIEEQGSLSLTQSHASGCGEEDMNRRLVPHIVDGTRPLTTVSPDTTVEEAARRLRADHVAAALVMEGCRLVGIVTERDITYRVVAEGLAAGSVRVGEIMTPDPVTGWPEMTAAEALEVMRRGHFRHLPVLRDGVPFAVVSIRHLYEAVRASLEEDLEQTASFIYGESYGASG